MNAIVVLNETNLNLPAMCEQGVYGKTTLNEINTNLTTLASNRGRAVTLFAKQFANPAAAYTREAPAEGMSSQSHPFTHFSVALQDAWAAVSLSLKYNRAREDFFPKSNFGSGSRSDLRSGAAGHEYAVQYALDYKN